MSWLDISFETTPAHERIIDIARSIFGKAPSTAPWKPHLSLAYDQPDETVLSWSDIQSEIERVPSLLEPRAPTKLSLWSTEGTMSKWKRIETVALSQLCKL